LSRFQAYSRLPPSDIPGPIWKELDGCIIIATS
jgi:hypothetical protein